MMGRYGWRNQDGVATLYRFHYAGPAICLDCHWRFDPWPSLTPAAVRARAHRHIAQTGHRVAVDSTTSRHYGPDPVPAQVVRP